MMMAWYLMKDTATSALSMRLFDWLHGWQSRSALVSQPREAPVNAECSVRQAHGSHARAGTDPVSGKCGGSNPPTWVICPTGFDVDGPVC
jgi:hypothetical protein